MKWIGKTKCDNCTKECKKYLYDAKHSRGSWGVFCENCFNMEGLKLGIGLGQQYEKISEDYIKIGGR
jgi:hypothetical protein